MYKINIKESILEIVEKNNSNYKVSYIRNGRIIVYSINTDSKRYIVYRKIKTF